ARSLLRQEFPSRGRQCAGQSCRVATMCRASRDRSAAGTCSM
ncbi:MAG: hypothetical protein AVDCRST_MAG87-1790, partial [uncultured Thermomicrobiales bacterium]